MVSSTHVVSPVKAEAVARALLARRLVDEAVGQSSKLIMEAKMTARRLLDLMAADSDTVKVPVPVQVESEVASNVMSDVVVPAGRVAPGILARRMASLATAEEVVDTAVVEKKKPKKSKKKPKKKKDKKRK